MDRLKPVIDQNWPAEAVLCSIRTTPGHTLLSDSPEPLGAWLGNFNAITILSGPGTKRLPPFSHISKPYE
ncbi:hypothetical protein TNCV_1149141 [Trichonephila clavipes]|nr:hypothetical protein TNCV_1149141 [Trichonephila clavipes]